MYQPMRRLHWLCALCSNTEPRSLEMLHQSCQSPASLFPHSCCFERKIWSSHIIVVYCRVYLTKKSTLRQLLLLLGTVKIKLNLILSFKAYLYQQASADVVFIELVFMITMDQMLDIAEKLSTYRIVLLLTEVMQMVAKSLVPVAVCCYNFVVPQKSFQHADINALILETQTQM